jgi:hypothetical protein
MDFFLDSFVLQSISNAGSVQQCGRHFRKRGAGKMRMEASGWRAFRERVAAWNQPPGWRLCPPARAAAAGAEQTEQSKRAAQRGGGDGGTSIAGILIQSSVCEHAVNAGRSPAAVRSRPRPTDRPTDRPARPFVSARPAQCDTADTRCAGHDTRTPFLLRRWAPPDAPGVREECGAARAPAEATSSFASLHRRRRTGR